MSYSKQEWSPDSSGTPKYVTPSRMNHIEQGIYNNSVEADKVPQLRTDTDSLILAEKVENGQRASLAILGYSCPKLSDTVYDYVSDNVLHKKVGRVDLGSLSWAYDSAKSYFSSNPLSNPKLPTSNWEVLNNVCSKFTSKAYQSIYNGEQDNTFAIHSSGAIWVRSTSYTSASTFKSAMQGTYLYYELSTEQTYSVLDNNALDSVGTCTNLLKPTLASGVISGTSVTVTDNGNGTYTLNGSYSGTSTKYVTIASIELEVGKKYKFVGMPSGVSADIFTLYGTDNGSGIVFTPTSATVNISLRIHPSANLSNVVIKPMLTTNLSAQYSDYVPFTGTSGRLNSDVAEIHNRIVVDKVTLTQAISVPTTYTHGTFDVTKSGYTPMGIVGYSWEGDNVENIIVSRLYVEGNNVKTLLSAKSGTSSITKAVLHILYFKN